MNRIGYIAFEFSLIRKFKNEYKIQQKVTFEKYTIISTTEVDFQTSY